MIGLCIVQLLTGQGVASYQTITLMASTFR